MNLPLLTPSIRSRVMAVIESKIADSQREYNDGCEQLDEKCKIAITEAKRTRDENKEALATKCVENILGKIL